MIPQITQEKYVDKRDCTCNVNTESKEALLKYCNSSAPELKKAKWIKGFKSCKCQSDLQPQKIKNKWMEKQTQSIHDLARKAKNRKSAVWMKHIQCQKENHQEFNIIQILLFLKFLI